MSVCNECSHTPFTHTRNRASRVKSRNARRDGLRSAYVRPHTLPEDPGALLPILGGATAGALLPRCCFTEVYVRPRASVRVCEPVWPTTPRVMRAPARPVSCPRLQTMSLPCPFPTACSNREHDAPMDGLAQPRGVLAGAAMAGLKPSGKQCNSTAPDATAADRAHHLRWHCLRAHISGE